ncbi:hypothetical protein JCM17380_26780 [Desulfosporosinus burensis]
MMHPDTELRFISDEIGLGVFATKFIPKGTIVWILDDLDLILDEDYVDSLDEIRQEIIYKYSYQDNDDNYILCWDHARYMNHSFHSNCVDTAYEFELAARDIFPGEEMTCDYGAMGYDEEFKCQSEGTARTSVNADDYLFFYQEWDEIAKDAFTMFNSCDQPLKHLISKDFADKVSAVACGLEPLDSILTTFIDDESV